MVMKRLRENLSATSLFLKEWVRRPGQIGAIAPSSRNLGQAMAKWISPGTDDLVLELGPGTGVITQALLDRGLKPSQLIAIEQSERLAELLQGRFPDIRVLTGDACHLDQLLAEHGIPIEKIAMVVSSLPLRGLKPAIAAHIGKAIHSVLPHNGCWVQYSYHLGKERAKVTQNFKVIRANIVWWNLPPARVSLYQKTGFTSDPFIPEAFPA